MLLLEYLNELSWSVRVERMRPIGWWSTCCLVLPSSMIPAGDPPQTVADPVVCVCVWVGGWVE